MQSSVYADKRAALWFVIALTVGFFSVNTLISPAIAQVPPDAVQNESTTDSVPAEPQEAEHVAVNEVTSDDAIQSRLNEILAATKWFEDVSVKVNNSVVFLEGTASDDQRKEWATDLVRNTEGVAAVVNNMQSVKTVDLSQTFQVVAQSVRSLWEDFLMRSPLILAGLLALIITAMVSKLAKAIASRIASKSRLRISLQDLILQLLTITIWVTGLLIAAVIIFPGMTPARALTVLGLGSVAVGFAFKDIFENFFAGILILWKYPFDRGDFVECNEVKGQIEDITIRMTMIRQVDGQLVVVPNGFLFKNPVDVLTSRSSRRTTIICGVAYDTNLNKARDLIHKTVNACSTVRQEQEVEIFAQEFAASSINFEVTWWTGATPLDIRKSRDEVIRAVKRGLDEADIEIPFPQRTLWFPKSIEVQGQT